MCPAISCGRGADLIPAWSSLSLGWLGMFGGAAQQILPLVLAQHQIALVLAQDVGTQLVPGQVLDVVTGTAIGKIGDGLEDAGLGIVVVGRLQRVEGGGGAGLDAHPVAEVPATLLGHQQMALIRPILFDPAGDAPGSELLTQGRQGGQGDLVHKGAGLLLGGGAQQVIHPGAPLLAVPEVSGGGEAPGRVLLVCDKAAAESEAEQHHDEGKRQGGDEGHGLECRQPPCAHQGTRGDPEQQSPEQALPDR